MADNKYNWDADNSQELDEDGVEYCGECDCEACRAYYDEHGFVPEVDCEAANSEYIRCKCNSCEFRLGQLEEADAEKAGDTAAPASAVAGFFDAYCENLVNPAPEKRIDPKKMYITLGAVALGSVLVFLFLGWLLCYCPVKTTGFSVDEFIAEFNAIVSDADVNALIEGDVAKLTASDSDVNVLYPDFTDLTIPEDANLSKGVLLCGGDVLVKAKVVGGKIQTLTVSLTESCDSHNGNGRFITPEGVDADYSTFSYYSAVGKARLAFYNIVCRINGADTAVYTLNDSVNYGVVMEQFAYYVYTAYGTYDPTLTYYEYSDTASMEFDPVTFTFKADTLQKTIIEPTNGIYEFFDGIFGEKEEAAADNSAEDADASVTETVVASVADAVSGADEQ